MKTKNEKNKVERQVNYLKNYLGVKVRVESNHYFSVENKNEIDDVFVTTTQPRLVNGRFGSCYLFEFDNGNLFAPCWAVCFCRNEAGTILIKTKNQNWKQQSIGCDDFCEIKNVKQEIKIRINSEHCGWEKAQKAIDNCYSKEERTNYEMPKLEKL